MFLPLVTVVINNFNYAEYLNEAIDSVLRQSYTNIEIIIIDDGSTDNSKDIISKYENDNMLVIYKKNGGQLSTFNEAKSHISGNIIFFLDADDIYKDNYVENIVNLYQRKNDIDFIFCAFERFYENGKKEIVQQYETDCDFGFTAISTLFTQQWLGGETSTISMKKDVYNLIVPIPYENDWRTRADDCLIWGASVVGARKYFYHIPSVLYRVHNSNGFFGRSFSSTYEYKRMLAINRLFKHFNDKVNYGDTLLDILFVEFSSRPSQDLQILKLYFYIVRAIDKSFLRRIKYLLKLILIYKKK